MRGLMPALAVALALAAPGAADEGKGKGKGHEKHGAKHAEEADEEGRSGMRFAGMDRNHDGVITRAEWRGNDRSFRNHDWNGDGVLSGPEVAAGESRPEPEDLDRSVFGHLDRNDDGRLSRDEWSGSDASWRAMDLDHDGYVTRPEFYAAPRAVPPVPLDRFSQLDHNRDGVLTIDEWHGDRYTFNQLDRNRDGVVSRGEFSAPPAPAIPEGDRFPVLDRNGDGVISRSEWPHDTAAFDYLDLDRNGVVSRDEFRLERFRREDRNGDGSITRAEWSGDDESFSRRDANRDGRISREEYLRY